MERQLTAFDAGRRLAAIRARLVAARGRLDGAVTRRRDRAAARFAEMAGRLETLSPLAVLGRGYAVCWNADRTRVLRDVAQTAAGQRVRVRLAKGELDCEVKSSDDGVH